MTLEEKINMQVDTIMRDEAYDGAYGAMSEVNFDNMCARVAGLVVDMLKEEELL